MNYRTLFYEETKNEWIDDADNVNYDYVLWLESRLEKAKDNQLSKQIDDFKTFGQNKESLKAMCDDFTPKEKNK